MDLNVLEQQLGDFTWCISTGLRAGYNLKQTFEALADQAPEPAVQICQHMLADLNRGVSLQAALGNLKAAFPSAALGRLVDACLQHQSESSLAELLDSLSGEMVRQYGSDPAFHAVMRQEAETLGASLPARLISA